MIYKFYVDGFHIETMHTAGKLSLAQRMQAMIDFCSEKYITGAGVTLREIQP